MTDYNNIVNDLLSINDTMFAIGTSNKNIDKISMRMAFDKNWHNIAERAAAAIEALIGTVGDLQAIRERLEEENDALRLEPKRGEWIFDGKFMELHKFRCSNCKRTEFRMSDYCPNCGADMRKLEVQE